MVSRLLIVFASLRSVSYCNKDGATEIMIISQSFSENIPSENQTNFFLRILCFLSRKYELLTMDSIRDVLVDSIETPIA